MPHRNLLLLLATALISAVCYVRAEQNPYARYIASGYSTINRWSLEDVPDQKLFEGAMQGMIGVLREAGDEHSAFINAERHPRYREDLTQQFGGIGVEIRLLGDPALPTIVGPPKPKSPALQAGLHSGDQISAVGETPTAGLKLDETMKLMRGPIKTSVALTVQRENETNPLEFNIERAMIDIESVYGDLRDEQGNWTFRLADHPQIGYIRITMFGDLTVAEVTRALASLTKPKPINETLGPPPIEALILDVRDNGGGTLDAAVDISDLFLRAGQPIVTTRGRNKKIRDEFTSTGNGGYTQIPIAILSNHGSASASEIVAACLQDYGRAVVFGERSYGKGTVQRLFTHIESGRSLLKLTLATYWRPNKQNIHRMKDATEQEIWGVKPNPGCEVKLDEDANLLRYKFRARRDRLGANPTGRLADQLNQADGELPTTLPDQALLQAVEYLESVLVEKK